MPVFKTGAINHSATSPGTTVLLQSQFYDRRVSGGYEELRCPVWIHQDLAGFTCFQAGHGFGKIFHRNTVGDHGVKIETPAFEQGSHLVPGLVHAAAVDTLNGEAFENDVFGEVERYRFRGEAEERYTSATADDVEGGSNGVGMAGHFEDHVHTEASGFFGDDGTHIFLRRIERVVSVHPGCKLAPVFVDFDREDRGCAYGSCHGDREQPDGAAAGDGYSFCGDFSGEHRVYGIAQRIENGSVLLRSRRIEFPDIRLGDNDVLGKSSVGVDADDFHVLADMSFAGAALQTLAAGHVHFGGYEIAFLDAGYLIAERGHLAAEFVSGDQWRMNAPLRPAIPFIDVEIGAANGSDFDFDEDFGAAVAGNFDFADFRARGGFRLDHCEHLAGHAAGHGSPLLSTEWEEQTGYSSTGIWRMPTGRTACVVWH